MDLLPPRAPSQRAPWSKLGGAGQEPWSPSDGDAPNVAGGVGLPGIELAASQLKGFGVNPLQRPSCSMVPTATRTGMPGWDSSPCFGSSLHSWGSVAGEDGDSRRL